MHFAVSDDCLKLGLRAGAILFRDLRVAEAPPQLRAEIADAARDLQARYPDPALIRTVPEVMHFQEILGKVGINPRKEQPSVERLLAHAHKRGDLPQINSLVDAYNLISVRSLCSLGAHDVDTLALPVTLRLLTGDESFTPLGRNSPVAVTAGEYGYVDAQNRLLCRLDVLQANFSKVTHNTKNALLIVEATAGHAPENLQQTYIDSIALITRYCGRAAGAAVW